MGAILEECVSIYNESLSVKDIAYVVDCGVDMLFRGLDSLYDLIRQHFSRLSNTRDYQVVFNDNEAIDDDYIIYRFHVVFKGIEGYIGVRAISYRGEIRRLIYVFGRETSKLINCKPPLENIKPYTRPGPKSGEAPPGQRFVPDFIIYRSLGQPEVDINKWFLEITGLIDKPLRFNYQDLLSMDQVVITRDFHCVTGWSVRSVVFEGVLVKELLRDTVIKPEAKWVYVAGLDGYTTSIPLEDFMVEDSLIVLRINGKELTLEQGYPARLFIPHLYGWKGVKWLKKIVFTDKYLGGYWESLGYHPRGNVWLNERFKQGNILQ